MSKSTSHKAAKPKNKFDPYRKGARRPLVSLRTVLANLEDHGEGRVVGEYCKQGNKYAEALVAQYVHYSANPLNKEKQRLLCLCYQDFKRSVNAPSLSEPLRMDFTPTLNVLI
jgi:hypothetical protein